MAIAIPKLNKYFMERIDPEDLSAVENVQRYIELVRLYRQMRKDIEEDGPRIIVENSSQSFIKSHPLISDMKNINAQLINLKKDIDKSIKDYAVQKESEKDEYDSGDLL